MTVRCLFPRDQEPHAQPRVRPRELSKHQEQRTLAPFPKAGREIGARCLGSPFTAQRPSLCAMWSICSMARALSGIQVQGAASLREQTQNSTEPRQSHSSFTSDKAHLDKTGRSMWTRLVTTRPVSDQKLKYSADVSVARKQSSFRAQYSKPHTHGGSLWLVVFQRAGIGCRNNTPRSTNTETAAQNVRRQLCMQLWDDSGSSTSDGDSTPVWLEVDCRNNALSARVSQLSCVRQLGWFFGTSPRRWPLDMLALPNSSPRHSLLRCAHDLDQPCGV